VYTTLTRVKTIDSLYLLKPLSQNNFHVANKVLDEMNRLTTNASWIVEDIERPNWSINNFSISTLNTRSLWKHLGDVVQDKDLIENMVVFFQETSFRLSTNC
jgi:hypothetical protein